MTSNTEKVTPRIPALDLLRVIAIAVLVFYHHLMVYVPDWGFHFKNESNWLWLQNLMLLSSPWRLGVLWLVSGISLSFMMRRLTIQSALYQRSTQLLFPLLIGVLIIVPPQLFVEMKQAKAMPLDLWQFFYALYFDRQHYFDSFTSGIWPSIDVNHLWFLRSLWQFSLLAIVISPLLSTKQFSRITRLLATYIWLLVVGIFAIVACIEWSLVGEIKRELYGLLWFLVGFCLAEKQVFWLTLRKHAVKLVISATMAMLLLQLCFTFIWQDKDSAESLLKVAEVIYWFNKTIFPVAILAVVYRWGNKENTTTMKLSTFVFPLYIIHQTLSILVAYWFSISSLTAFLSVEWQMLYSLIVVICLSASLLYVLGKIDISRICFGMKPLNMSAKRLSKVRFLAFCCCLPIGYEILF